MIHLQISFETDEESNLISVQIQHKSTVSNIIQNETRLHIKNVNLPH